MYKKNYNIADFLKKNSFFDETANKKPTKSSNFNTLFHSQEKYNPL